VSLEHLTDLARLAERCAAALEAPVAAYLELVRATLKSGGTLYFAGNGGSAAHAQHMATEYVVRYARKRRAVRALALSTDTSLLTAAANDLGYEAVFERQVEAHVRAGDLLVLVSTSGDSPNLIRAAAAARARGVRTVGLLGREGGALKAQVDLAIVVPSDDTALVQEVQLAIDHHVCAAIELEIGGGAEWA
jgi:D-sedoheptulose 7-phosphate isomerase